MKKLSVLLVVAAAIMNSCTPGANAPQANLKTDVDSLAYSIGVTSNLLQYATGQMGLDSAYVDEFLKGIVHKTMVEDKDDKKAQAYNLGLEMGAQVNQMYEGLNKQFFGEDSTSQLGKETFIAGVVAGALNKDLKIDAETAKAFAEKKGEEIYAKQMEKTHGPNKEAGISFLEENKSKEGVVTLPSGLQYKVLKEGKGAIPTANSTVRVDYVGTLVDGTEFDSSVKRGEPAEFPVGGVIKGWVEALQLMPVGSKWELYVPQELAYGPADKGTIKPFSTLIFEVELLDILDVATPPTLGLGQ